MGMTIIEKILAKASGAAKVAEKVPVLFQHQHIRALTGQQQTRDQSGRPAAHDATCRLFFSHDCTPL